MESFELLMPKRIIFGRLKDVNRFTKNSLLVTTKFLYELYKDRVKHEKRLIIKPESSKEALDIFYKTYDNVIGLGGGSAMDVAKYLHSDNLTLIPTTLSGAEVTHEVVLMEDGKKKSFKDRKYLPNIVIYDSKLLETLPDRQKDFSIVDMMLQAIESKISKNSNDVTRNFAENSLWHLMDYFRKNRKSDEDLFKASYFAGISFGNCGTNLTHALSYPLSNRGIPHGEAIAIVMKETMKYNKTLDEIPSLLEDYVVGCLEKYKPTIKIEPKIFAKEVWANNQRHLGNNPKDITLKGIENIYHKIK